MIGKPWVATMAEYNRWQNENLYTAAGELDDSARRAERGAFFGSIHATLNHVLWDDQVWMSRLAGCPRPAAQSIAQSLRQHDSFQDLARARVAFDHVTSGWANALDPAWLEGGQVHAMLTAAGVRPGDTDLPFMPDAGSGA